MKRKFENNQVLITRLDGGYILELSYPRRADQVIRLTITDVIDVLINHFGEPFRAGRGEPTSAVEEWANEKHRS